MRMCHAKHFLFGSQQRWSVCAHGAQRVPGRIQQSTKQGLPAGTLAHIRKAFSLTWGHLLLSQTTSHPLSASSYLAPIMLLAYMSTSFTLLPQAAISTHPTSHPAFIGFYFSPGEITKDAVMCSSFVTLTFQEPCRKRIQRRSLNQPGEMGLCPVAPLPSC